MAYRVEKLRASRLEQLRTNKKRWKLAHPEAYKADYMRTNAKRDKTWERYKITSEERAWRLLAQGGRCEICKTILHDKGEMDHDHACCDKHGSCGLCLRGILCSRCNRILGSIETGNWDVEIPAMTRYIALYEGATNG